MGFRTELIVKLVVAGRPTFAPVLQKTISKKLMIQFEIFDNLNNLKYRNKDQNIDNVEKKQVHINSLG